MPNNALQRTVSWRTRSVKRCANSGAVARPLNASVGQPIKGITTMRRYGLFAITISLCIAFLLLALKPSACSCQPWSDVERYQVAVIVFKGIMRNTRQCCPASEIFKINPPPASPADEEQMWETEFEVEVPLKGNPTGIVTIISDRPGSSCVPTFEKGKSYLVFANNQRGHLVTNGCLGTAPCNACSERLSALEELAKKCK